MAFPFVKQYDAMQCGISCISMICRYYGKKFSLKFLESHCHPSKEGVSFKSLADLCEYLHLDYAAGRVSLDEISDCPLPCIIHWNQNHFVILYKVDKKGDRFWIADPAKGKYTLTRNEFVKHWISTVSNDTDKGLAMFFQKTDDFERLNLTELENKRSFRFLWQYILQYKGL